MPAATRAESGGRLVGLLLAAGAGRRMGGPKALLQDAAGHSLVSAAVTVLLEGGCASVVVVVGASAHQVDRVLRREVDSDPRVRVVVAEDWKAGQGASLRAGLIALDPAGPLDPSTDTVAAIVMVVDLPGVGPAAVRRVAAGAGPTTLARATYDGRPGHPVLLGRDHWPAVLAALDPDRGARDYLAAHPGELIPCEDVADGQDVDEPDDARRRGLRHPRPDVMGPTVDEQTRCVHYHGPHDVVAIEFACCGDFYPCHLCHQETAGHPAEQWSVGDRDVHAILCGACGRTLSIHAYLDATGCPWCDTPFNAGCRTHYPFYFEVQTSASG